MQGGRRDPGRTNFSIYRWRKEKEKVNLKQWCGEMLSSQSRVYVEVSVSDAALVQRRFPRLNAPSGGERRKKRIKTLQLCRYGDIFKLVSNLGGWGGGQHVSLLCSCFAWSRWISVMGGEQVFKSWVPLSSSWDVLSSRLRFVFIQVIYINISHGKCSTGYSLPLKP